MDLDPELSYPEPMSPDDEDFIADGATDEGNETQKVAYGPKMTVHSRAPWEIDEEDSAEKDEQDPFAKKSVLSFSRKDHSKKSRGRDARRQDDSRPGVDCIRSQSRSKQSSETTSSQASAGGALLYVI